MISGGLDSFEVRGSDGWGGKQRTERWKLKELKMKKKEGNDLIIYHYWFWFSLLALTFFLSFSFGVVQGGFSYDYDFFFLVLFNYHYRHHFISSYHHHCPLYVCVTRFQLLWSVCCVDEVMCWLNWLLFTVSPNSGCVMTKYNKLKKGRIE